MNAPAAGLQVPFEAMAAALTPPERRRLMPFLLSSGRRVEVDLSAAAAGGEEELARRLHRYFLLARSSVMSGTSLPCLRLEVTLLDVRQSTSKAAPADLVGELEDLQRVPQLAPLLTLLDPLPPARIPGCRLTSPAPSLLRAALDVTAPLWPLGLGGPPSPFESFRRVAVTASHAAWRDRRLRRLVRVEVVSHQDWPDPAHLGPLI